MAESHTKGAQLHRPVTPEGGGQSAMTRVSYAKPFRPYVWRGGEPATAARERHRALNAAREAAEIMPDIGPGPEWYRELKEEDELAELAAERDRYQAAMAAVPEPCTTEPESAPPPVAKAARCRRCKYLTTSAGHRVMCDE